jgi:hypothetical protein
MLSAKRSRAVSGASLWLDAKAGTGEVAKIIDSVVIFLNIEFISDCS